MKTLLILAALFLSPVLTSASEVQPINLSCSANQDGSFYCVPRQIHLENSAAIGTTTTPVPGSRTKNIIYSLLFTLTLGSVFVGFYKALTVNT